jgi:hypothetical protein
MYNKTIAATLSLSLQARELPENVFVYNAEEEALLKEKDDLIALQQKNIAQLGKQTAAFTHNAAVRFGVILDLKTQNNILINEVKTRQEQYEKVRREAAAWRGAAAIADRGGYPHI